MSDTVEFLVPSPKKAAWVIDVAQGTVSWSNAIAKQRFGEALGVCRDGLVYIHHELKHDLAHFLAQAQQSTLLCFHWLLRDTQDELYRCTATVISLGESRHGFSVEAYPCPAETAQYVPRSYGNKSIPERLNSLILMSFTGEGEKAFLSSRANALFPELQNIRSMFAVQSAAQYFIDRVQREREFHQEIRLSTVEGVRWFQLEAHQNPQNGHIDIYAQDIQELRDYEVQLYRLQNYDGLTHLPNRSLLYQQLEIAKATANKRERMFGVMYLDLDGFKVVNDTFGHRVGDQLLQQVANRIKTTIPTRSCLYRLGGDEFVVVMEHVQDITELEDIARQINETGVQSYPVSDMEMLITTSIGIACYPMHGSDIDTLLMNADAAMYRSKANAHNGYRVYEEVMSEGFNAYLTLGGGLRKAIEEGQFELYYQPKVRSLDEQTVGAEALIRWHHPEWGMIAPDKFIPIAEESGLILPLGEWVIRRACQQLKIWQEQGLAPISLSVNLSGRQFLQPNLVDVVQQILDETDINPKLLELELTESMLMSDVHGTIKKLHDFREMGVSLSIDDFGTGYSSLAYLKKFPIQALKIDRSFIQDLGIDGEDDAIVKATIAMAQSLNLKVIAEGVENRQQMSLLTDYQCQEVQGYLFAKPMSCTDFEVYLEKFSNSCSDECAIPRVGVVYGPKAPISSDIAH
ncbi:Cyclic di-GMP phosphodiesterase Gmr [Marinomonas aquimarina]|uniref:cyclic-guanylate-specific phosphodiesterase n=1 Tax=Marinomonas aquimarina TaxID=295068 RepID=A0A1A8TDS3_9GAMM|nr:EAL domain-containing protein [Marinomonas aquimarina]SBS30185.1 Cyclic di-GMP phosphodiesterase Gmr [Marinomonas aquimarina]